MHDVFCVCKFLVIKYYFDTISDTYKCVLSVLKKTNVGICFKLRKLKTYRKRRKEKQKEWKGKEGK